MAEQSTSRNPAIKRSFECNENAVTTSGRCDEPDENWQASKRLVKERGAFMFNNEMLSDIRFIVGAEGTQVKRIPAHKFMLSIGSSVFQTMFYGSLANNSDEIRVTDVEPAAFLTLLRFLYSDELQIDADNVLSTLNAAKKYIVPVAVEECIKFLEKSLTSDNVFALLMQARFFDERELIEKCLEVIDRSAAAFEAENFLDLDLNALCSVLSRDTLYVKEILLFHAIKRWSEAECKRQNLLVKADNQRRVLGEALKLIRFPVMSAHEFASHVAQSGLLHEKEVITLFVCLNSIGNKQSTGFIDRPRKSTEILVMNRFLLYPQLFYGPLQKAHEVEFTVNHPISVVGFGLYRIPTTLGNVTICIELFGPGRFSLGKRETALQNPEHLLIFRVMFEKPIPIGANTHYKAYVKFKTLVSNPVVEYGHDCATEVHVKSLLKDFTFKIFPADDHEPTDIFGASRISGVTRRQIPEILFIA